MRTCKICLEAKEDRFFTRGISFNSYCKSCDVKRVKSARDRFKLECVAYKGGKCCKCGYNKSPYALDFHHKDPSKKSFSFGSKRITKMTEAVMIELDKCDCMCANCHRELHYA